MINNDTSLLFRLEDILDFFEDSFDLLSDFDNIKISLLSGLSVAKDILDVADHVFDLINHTLEFLGMINNDTSLLFGLEDILNLFQDSFDLLSDSNDIKISLLSSLSVAKDVFDVAQHIFNSVDHSLDFLGMVNNDTSFLFGLEDIFDMFQNSFDLLSNFNNIDVSLFSGLSVAKNILDIAYHVFYSVNHILELLGLFFNSTSLFLGFENILDFFEDSFDLLSDFDDINISPFNGFSVAKDIFDVA